MSSYEFTQTIHQHSQIVHEDEIRILEKEATPTLTDYYGVLNISKQATEDEIKEAYEKLSQFFQPEKQETEEKKKMAESRFQVIQRAYEVLSNTDKKSIYDTYGEEGLNATKEVGPRHKTLEQLREEYEKKARQEQDEDLENLIQSKSEFQLVFDATQILDPYEPPSFAGFGQPIKPSKKKGPFHVLGNGKAQQLGLKHTFETELGPKTMAILGGTMITRSGMGEGNLFGTIRHTVSPKLWGEITATALSPRLLTLKSYYTINSESFVNTTAQISSIHDPPVMHVTLGRKLSESTTGYMIYKTGEWSLLGWGDTSNKTKKSSVALGLTGSTKNGNYRTEIQTGILSSRVLCEYSHKLARQALLKLSCSLSSRGGITTSIGSDHKVSEFIRAGMSIECGASGVIVKLRASRLGQKIMLPIILSNEFDLKVAFFGAVLPTSIVVAIDQFVLKPRQKRLLQQKLEELREEHSEYLQTRRQEALDAQTLMADISERKKKQEEKKADGLVIVRAWYGDLDKGDQEEGTLDVTIPIQTLVNESRLVVPGGYSKSNILGFYDPCLGEKKKLRVQYKYRQKLHQVTVEDSAPLICPADAHIV